MICDVVSLLERLQSCEIGDLLRHEPDDAKERNQWNDLESDREPPDEARSAIAVERSATVVPELVSSPHEGHPPPYYSSQ